MSVPVTVVARKNPAKQNEPEKFYAMAQAAGEMNFRSLCKDASEGCTVLRRTTSESSRSMRIIAGW